jgi:hypothetical protein
VSETDPKDPNTQRARLQQLRSIPEAKRTDAEWDELNELEITAALSNGQGGPNPNARAFVPGNQQQQRRQGGGGGGGGGGGQQRQGGRPRHGQQDQQGRKFRHRPNRGGGGGGGGGGPR